MWMPLSAMSGCITHESFYFLVSLHMHFLVFASCCMGPNHFRQPIQPFYHKKQDQIPHTFRFHALFLWDSRLVTLSFPFTLAGLCRTIEWVTETVVALFLHVFISLPFCLIRLDPSGRYTACLCPPLFLYICCPSAIGPNYTAGLCFILCPASHAPCMVLQDRTV